MSGGSFCFALNAAERSMNWYHKHEVQLWGLAILAIMAFLIGASSFVAHN
jgi:hypothetical protein